MLAPIEIFCLVTETKGQTLRGISGFYSTSGVVDCTAVVFSAHLVAVKCEVFTTISARELQLFQQPSGRVPPTSGKSRTTVQDFSERGLLSRR